MINFDEVKNLTHSRIRELLPSWLPGGVVKGNEYVCADITGGDGKSFSVNLTTGVWKDFAGTVSGGDLISLYAKIHGYTQVKSKDELYKMFRGSEVKPKKIDPTPKINIIKPPKNEPRPNMKIKTYGEPTDSWVYRNSDGDVLFYIARYDLPGGGKSFSPFCYTDSHQWTRKAWPTPRPLYGLELLKDPSKPTLIVEGERAAEAARIICGNRYQIISWPNGAGSTHLVDWSPLHGFKNIVIWPDADDEGRKAAAKIAENLLINSPSSVIKIIASENDMEGWDAADALDEGWDWDQLKTWAKPLMKPVPMPQKPIIPEVIAAEKIPSAVSDVPKVMLIDGTEPADNQDAKDLWARMGLALTGSGSAMISIANVTKVFDNYPAMLKMVKYDEFTKRVFIDFNESTLKRDGKFEKLKDSHTLALTIYIQQKIGLHKVSYDIVKRAVSAVATFNKFNGPKDWISSLAWDSKPRVANWLKTYMGCDESDGENTYSKYIEAAGTNFWIGLIARVFDPGCKVDNMLILEGPQGNRKSSSLQAIGGEWYTQSRGSVKDKDFLQTLAGKMIVEIAELDSFGKAEDSAIKAMITSNKDDFRKVYKEENEDYHRQCVFVGTTNDSHYLKDPTGGRRFWPVKTNKIDLDALKRDREQLFAEALFLFKSGATWYEMPAEETLEVQDSRRQVDAWETHIATFLTNRTETTIVEIATSSQCLNLDIGRVTKTEDNRIGKILRSLGWENKVRKIKGTKKTERRWMPKSYYADYVPPKQMDLSDMPNSFQNGNGKHLNGYVDEAESDELQNVTDFDDRLINTQDDNESEIIF